VEEIANYLSAQWAISEGQMPHGIFGSSLYIVDAAEWLFP
jgi:hypothetical protein